MMMNIGEYCRNFIINTLNLPVMKKLILFCIGLAMAACCKYEEVVYFSDTGSYIDLRDYKNYNWVTVGTQTWMTDNLAYLPSLSSQESWQGADKEKRYYVFGYEDTIVNVAKSLLNYTTYGVLYNWPAAMNGAGSSTSVPSGVQGICPPGWHLPSDAEWGVLEAFLGANAGGKMKETGTSHWKSPNTGATNESGFTAIPGGSFGYYFGFSSMGLSAVFWTSTEGDSLLAVSYGLYYRSKEMNRGNIAPSGGCSVRCLKD